MHIRSLRLKQIRCFQSVNLDLSRDDGSLAGWTVFAGKNAAGKTTLLQAIAAIASGFSEGLFDPAHFLREGESSWSGTLTIVKGPCDQTDAADLSCKLSWAGNFRKDDRGLQGIEYLDHPPGCLMLGYGPFRRLSGHTSDALERMSARFWSGRLLTLFRNDASLAETVSWLQNLDYRSLRKEPGYHDLKTQALALLDDGLFPDGVNLVEIGGDGLKIEHAGRQLILRQLSDGYKAVASLVVDILRNLFQSFGSLTYEKREDEQGEYPVVANDGVVLIDEVETHLHVSWQRDIGFWLKKHFPNVQFLVTTHSPFVCQAADSNGIIRMPDPASEESVGHVAPDQFRQIVNGNSDDATTSCLFGLTFAHSDQAELIRQRFAELEVSLLYDELSESDRWQKRAELEQLRTQLPLGLQAP